MKIFEIGGSIRDELLGREVHDRDFAIECGSFEQMEREFLARGGTIYLSKPEFLAIRGKLPGIGDADFTMCRKEGAYSDSRHPDSVEPGTIYDHLNTRDFRMNAIARDVESGELIDPHDGLLDIQKGIIRCVGEPHVRIKEDSIRILRAGRFYVTLGFELELKLCYLLHREDVLDKLSSVSTERMREEVDKMFQYSTPKTLDFFDIFRALRGVIFSRNLKLKVVQF